MVTFISQNNKHNPLAFEDARESVTRLSALKPFLTSSDEETLSILMDKKLIGDLRKSLSDSHAGKVFPLHSVLSR